MDFHGANSTKQQSADRHVASPSNTASWFRTNSSLFFLFKYACLAKRQQIRVLSSLLYHHPSVHNIYHLTCTYCVQAAGQRNVRKVPIPVAINPDPHAEIHAVCPIPEWANFSTNWITACKSGVWNWRLPTKIKITLH
jgi:hypothetical protein